MRRRRSDGIIEREEDPSDNEIRDDLLKDKAVELYVKLCGSRSPRHEWIDVTIINSGGQVLLSRVITHRDRIWPPITAGSYRKPYFGVRSWLRNFRF